MKKISILCLIYKRLNPVYTIEKQLNEVYLTHQKISEEEASKRSLEMLKSVKIPNAESIMKQFPHQLSGGMREGRRILPSVHGRPDDLCPASGYAGRDETWGNPGSRASSAGSSEGM